ncbi:MAG: pro-sigmaK processing inhibitor BofA family protein [Ruthenibacterium sp.]
MTFAPGAGLLIAVIAVLSVCASLHRAQHPLRTALYSAGGGIAALGAVNLLALSTGVSIALNYATAFTAVVLGAPGIVCLLLLRLLLF